MVLYLVRLPEESLARQAAEEALKLPKNFKKDQRKLGKRYEQRAAKEREKRGSLIHSESDYQRTGNDITNYDYADNVHGMYWPQRSNVSQCWLWYYHVLIVLLTLYGNIKTKTGLLIAILVCRYINSFGRVGFWHENGPDTALL